MRPLIVCLLICSLTKAEGAAAQPAAETIDGRAFFLPLVMREAAARGLPPEIADAVAEVETGYRPDVVGSSGEIGLMQVMPATAAQLGFRGTLAELADPATNIRLGVTYLARAWSEGGGDICRALTKYRAGLGQESMTALSAQYCSRAVSWLMGGRGNLDRATASFGNPAPAAPTTPAPDPFVIVMPAARPIAPVPISIPAGIRLTPIFAMAHRVAPHARPDAEPAIRAVSRLGSFTDAENAPEQPGTN